MDKIKQCIKNTPKKKKIICVALFVVLFLLLVYFGISLFFQSHFLANAEINGYSCSMKTAAQTEKHLNDRMQEYEIKIYGKNGTTDSISGKEVSMTCGNLSDIKELLKKQRSLLWLPALLNLHKEDLHLKVSYDDNLFLEKVDSFQVLSADFQEAKSAYPKFDGEKYVIEPEVYGTQIDKEYLIEKLEKAFANFEDTLDLREGDYYIAPAFTKESDAVKAACDLMNSYCRAKITYPMDQDVVLDKSVISTWLSVDDKMNVVIDESAVKKWLEDFGNKYDTVGTQRQFTTPAGKSATVSGGTYGWSIDEDTEFNVIIEAVKSGETLVRDPALYIGGAAATHNMPDWGTTYIDVDLSAQHMWYVENGSVMLETDVVTGEPIPEKITPEGVYSILEMKEDETLVGAIVPGTGKPEYRTPVDYWMRVTWSGVGFHDANWQPAFGGTLNQIPNVGSHGCINMPVDKAQELYQMISVGTPVVIHY